MYRVGLTGDDLAAFVRESLDSAIEANEAAVRMSAYRAARDWRRDIKRNFGPGTKLYDSRGWSKGILVRKVGKDSYAVRDKASYVKKRGQKVDLSWVFDNAPTIRGRRGWVAVPIDGAAPRAASSRRYMWPSEAAAAGYELEIVPVMGKRFKLIMGRRGPRDAWRPMWFYVPPYKAKKGLDLNSIHRRHDAALDRTWGEEFDKKQASRSRKRR